MADGPDGPDGPDGLDARTRPPVEDWATDYDIFDPAYCADPGPVWAELRERCPIAHTERWGGSWLPTRYDDVAEMARRVPALSNQIPIVVPPVPFTDPDTGEVLRTRPHIPPISSDPPFHTPARRLILPAFAPQAVERHAPYTRELAHRLIDGFAAEGRCDGAVDYAQQIPPRVIAHLLGLDEGRADDFIAWVRGILELGATNPDLRVATAQKIFAFFGEEVRKRRAQPTGDFISEILSGDLDGQPVDDDHAVATCNLLLIAGIDTTWSSIGSALWHLATHPADRRRLVAEPELLATAVEELLRVYSPVTMGRIATEDVTIDGVTIPAGDRVLMNFPAANRDPAQFPDPDTVVIDRAHNRHVAFGIGIHRCAGSNLARMEMQVALSAFLERIPEFEVDGNDGVTWCGGQVRGPRTLPLRFGAPR
ncbi:MAG TPA: cytochrome P450 [Acidimicrobiia bacterium]|nr:cytochrome P450 [Acidimicrobiia bacterium]